MNWKDWLSFNPYKKLWFWAGRPFTYILRDIWHKAEFVCIVALIAIGVWAGHHFDWLTILKAMAVFTAGYIGGHLFWGKEYISNQQSNGGD